MSNAKNLTDKPEIQGYFYSIINVRSTGMVSRNRQPKKAVSVRNIIVSRHRKYVEDLRAEHPQYFREPKVSD